MDKQQIEHMVSRFLGWKLPEDFSPDGGVSYDKPSTWYPVGTNLLTATQAREMIEYITSELPAKED